MKNIPYEKTYINITLRKHMITIISPKKKARINNNYRFRKGRNKKRQKVKCCKRKKEGEGALTGKLNEMEDIYIPSF